MWGICLFGAVKPLYLVDVENWICVGTCFERKSKIVCSQNTSFLPQNGSCRCWHHKAEFQSELKQ